MWTIFSWLATIAGVVGLAVIFALLLNELSGRLNQQSNTRPFFNLDRQYEPREESPTANERTSDRPTCNELLDKRADAGPTVEFKPSKLRREERDTAQRRREPRFELIPHKMGGVNARLVLSNEVWRRLSKMVIKSNGGNCCECPNGQLGRMECHEVWEYEWVWRPGRRNKVGVMRLTGLRPLCHLCHMGKHIKFAESQGALPQVTSHLVKHYDGLSETRLMQLMSAAAARTELKYKYEELDLTYLNSSQFEWIHKEIGRNLTANEMANVGVDGPVRNFVCWGRLVRS